MKRLFLFFAMLSSLACYAGGYEIRWGEPAGKVQVSSRDGGSIVSVRSRLGAFSFRVKDVNADTPIWIPEYKVAVVPGGDTRSYDEIVRSIRERKLQSKIDLINRAPEASFEKAAEVTRKVSAPILLGISRDIRRFELCEELPDAISNLQMDKRIAPTNAYSPMVDASISPNQISYNYAFGRGVGPYANIRRSLEDGTMPIYHSDLQDDDIAYKSVIFTALERSELVEENVPGTHFMISDSYSVGRAFTDRQREQLQEVFKNTPAPSEETVLYMHTVISNSARVPRYAWIKIPYASFGLINAYDPATGFSSFADGRVFCVSTIDGRPAESQEMTVLLQPGQSINVDYRLLHSPVSPERASALAARPMDKVFRECKAYWQRKLDAAAHISVPEERIQNMIGAGLLHLDLITYGNREQGTLAANCGCYSPIGTESAPIIQFYESMGLLDQARGCLQYFIDTQQEDGKIVNFFGYTIETGAVLWSIGEYYHYSHDLQWLRSVQPQLLKACRYLMDWRARSMKEEYRGRGYGMVDGKVADPEDPYHQFMLNAYSYMGFKRMCEVFRALGATETAELEAEEKAWHKDILDSFRANLASSPVVPLYDGSWCPTCAPWAEVDEARFFLQKPDYIFSHGTFTCADALLGPLHLVFAEVLDLHSPEAAMLLKYHRDLFFQGNSAFSQPYYSKHNMLQARLGMVKPFLNTYYYTVAPHFDHETGTFWEHYFKMSVHKTHEEANFLMETRNMLYMESGDTLRVLGVAPRRWLRDGNRIVMEGVRSYFGRLDVKVESHLSEGCVTADITCPGEYRPSVVTVRLPHPQGVKAVNVEGGVYNARTETVTIDNFNGHATVRLFY